MVLVLKKRKELIWYGLSVLCNPTGIRDGGARAWCLWIPKARLALFPWRPLHMASGRGRGAASAGGREAAASRPGEV